MTRVMIDSVMFNKLNRLAEPLELCDSSGKVLARVVPECSTEIEPREPSISEEELDRRSKLRAKGASTEEVLKRLEKL